MYWKLLTIISMVWCATARPPHATSEQKFVQYFRDEPKKVLYVGSNKSENHEEYVDTYPLYEFSYKISDPHTHDFKGQEETRNGDKVNGDYWLIEPDGRKRIVKYHANDKIGFNVLVDYLQKNSQNPSQLKDQESYENGSEEKNNKENEEKNKSSDDNRNSVENIDSKELQESEDPNKESGEENIERQLQKQSEEVSSEKKSQVEKSSKKEDSKLKKNMRRKPYITENKISDNDQNTQSLIKNNGDGSNEKKIDSGKRKYTSNNKKQEKKTDSRNSNEVSKENENESKLKKNKSRNQKLSEQEKPIKKGYEVYEEINENSDENNTDSENDEINENKSEEKNTERNITEKSDGEIDKKSKSENKEEIYGYNTFIYHKRRH